MQTALSVLETRAALVWGWPRLWVETPSEAALACARAKLEQITGPLPQADELEPWDPRGDEPWVLRVDLPEVPHEVLAEMIRALEVLGCPARLEPADPPGLTEALDRGELVEDLVGDEVVARMLVDPLQGPVRPELVRVVAADPALVVLEAELARALATEDPRLLLRSDRGPDTVVPVIERATGRLGVELDLASDGWLGLDGDEILALRGATLRAVARVARARMDHADVQLSPRATWDTRLGALQVVVWLVAPPAPALPSDGRVAAGPPPLAWLDTLRRDAPGMVEDLEVQVVPMSDAVHAEVVAAASALAARAGWAGGRPRWLRTALGLRFCPTWRAAPDQLLHSASIAELPGVYGVRVVPGEPSGLAEAWPMVDAAWRLAPDRCFVRLRDARMDRDRLERVDERDADERDHAVAASVPQDVLPIRDRRGRRGLEVLGGAEALTEAGLAALLHVVGRLEHPDLCGIATFGFPTDGARVRLWYRDVPDPGPRVWRGQDQPPK